MTPTAEERELLPQFAALQSGANEPLPPAALGKVQAVIDALQVSRSKAYELILSGEIESVRVGGCRRVVLSSVDDFVARLRSAAS